MGISGKMASRNNKVDAGEEAKHVKVDKWDGTAIKNALDDAAKKVLIENCGYTESHSLMDGRLLICTISVAFAGYALLWDYFHPFPESRPVLIVCVISYFIMMGILTLYTSFKERGIFLVALEKDIARVDPDNVFKLSSQLKRYDDMYLMHLSYENGTTKETKETQFDKSVSNYFDENGTICTDKFEAEMKKLLDSIHEKKQK